MACIVYQVDKRSGIKYAYSSESYWDKEKKQPRSKRTFLGRVDPVTGDIIPKKVKPSSQAESEKQCVSDHHAFAALEEELKEKDRIISDLKRELCELKRNYKAAQEVLNKIHNLSLPFLEE